MTPLTKEFIDSCPVEGGFRTRGLAGLAVAVDGVLKEQIERLVSHLGRTGQVAKPE